jgi:asparagine synthase (glutamine-hydrolysing)
MCGICGKLAFDNQRAIHQSLLKSMLYTIRHRGPDGEGVYVGPQIGLGHKRLAIIDLKTGQQPLCNEDGSVWITFNGEIYNYQELKQYLRAKGHSFKTKSDTEVIVHLYEELGEACVEKLRGMFAFALWDSRNRLLLIARDRVGIKPLYYWQNNKSLVFASEIKAILADPEVSAELEPRMIDRFLTFDYVPGEQTLFRHISKLAPGSYLVARDGNVNIKQYWDLESTQSSRTLKEAEAELMDILEESVQLHMISDVPVGFLLSGGVDSTAMLGLAVGKSPFPLSSYTLGFSEPGITDERPYARLAANAYGVEHRELTITSAEFRDFLPHYVWHMEEPVCEPPAVALYYVSKLASSFVKVLISGEGGDEAFAGYQNYRSILWLERLKSALGPFCGIFSDALLTLNGGLRSNKIARFAPLLKVPFSSYYFTRTSTPQRYFNQQLGELYSKDFAACVDKQQSLDVVNVLLGNCASRDLVNRMLYVDTKTWLTDDLLLKADKMTMANSVELRVPLLDHKLLEFAASLPGHFKVRGFTTKYIAKQVLHTRVPQAILDRRKTGFPVPYGSWLRTDMKDWLSGLLLDQKSQSRGYFAKNVVEKLISDNMPSGLYSKELFSLAILELWHRVFLEDAGPRGMIESYSNAAPGFHGNGQPVLSTIESVACRQPS